MNPNYEPVISIKWSERLGRQVLEREAATLDREEAFYKNKTTFGRDNLFKPPVPKEAVLGRFPVCSTTAVVAGGGVGKTSWLSFIAKQVAEEGHDVVFVSAEDDECDYHHKLFAVRSDAMVDKVHVLNLKGLGVKLITEKDGSYIPSLDADLVAKVIVEHIPNAKLIVFETVSRFAGGEDNDRMEAIVSACDRIAIALNAAVVLVHHTGKGQSRDKVIDLYAGRGGSALGDNTRSMFVLTRLDKEYKGECPPKVSSHDIAEGRVFEVKHVRYSYGATVQPSYFLVRHSCIGLEFIELDTATASDVDKAAREEKKQREEGARKRVVAHIKAEGGDVKRRYFEEGTQKLIGLGQKEGRALIDEMLENNQLEEVEVAGSGNQKSKRLRLVIRTLTNPDKA